MLGGNNASCGGTTLGDDIACLGERDLCQQRTDQFQNHNGEQDDIADQNAVSTEGCDLQGHTERDTCLREQRDAEVFADLVGAIVHFALR